MVRFTTQRHGSKISSDNPVLLYGFLFVYLTQLKTSEILKEMSSIC